MTVPGEQEPPTAQAAAKQEPSETVLETTRVRALAFAPEV